MTAFHIIPIPAFNDNYIWLIRNDRYAAVVDPGDASPVLHYLAQEKLELIGILNTHHHPDHVGGNSQLLSQFKVPVYGPCDSRIPEITVALSEGDTFSLLPLALHLKVWEIPGHTRTHIAFIGEDIVFSGDTLFAAGCGRLFEGTPEQMHTALQRLSTLADETQIYCGHEYTLANLKFAAAVEPRNPEVAKLTDKMSRLRQAGMPTLPSNIAQEKACNPFLRVNQAEVIAAASQRAQSALSDPARIFAEIRDWKNNF